MFKSIPENTCPLNVIAEMGEEVKNARIYLGKKAVENLRNTADLNRLYGDFEKVINKLFWEKNDEYPSTLMKITSVCDDFFLVLEITADDIAFKKNPEYPKRIIFLEMED